MSYRAVILFISGTIVLLFAGFLGFQQLNLLSKSKTVEGTITDNYLEVNHIHSNLADYYPVVTFTTPDGKDHSFQSEVGSDPAEFKIGQHVNVYYQPSDPDNKAQINSWYDLWIAFACVLFFAILFLTAGFVEYARTRKSHITST